MTFGDVCIEVMYSFMYILFGQMAEIVKKKETIWIAKVTLTYD